MEVRCVESRLRSAAAASVAIAAALLSCMVASAETVAWYRFEKGMGKDFAEGIETVLDSSPNALHGTSVNPRKTVYAEALAPFGDVALTVGALDGWVFVPDQPGLQLTRSLTLEAFVNVRDFQREGAANFILFRGDNRDGTDAYWLALDPSRRTLHFRIEGPGRAVGDPPAIIDTPSDWLGKTIHVAGVLNAEAGSMGLYVDGELKASMETGIRSRGPLHPVYQPGLGIGGFFAREPGSFCIDGTIDEVRLSDVALKPEQFLCSRRPVLRWARTTGFEGDGVDPDSGAPGTRFRFAVRHADPSREQRIRISLRLLRDGAFYRALELREVSRSGDDAVVRLFEVRIQLPEGHYRYRFECDDDRVGGEPLEWQDGPTVQPDTR